MPIQPLEQVLKETLVTLGKYQNGEVSQIKTNRPWLDHQNGITPKSFITIFGASFGGKSTELENLKADIMDINVNPEAGEYVWVSNSFEMTNFTTTLRDVKKLTKLSFGDILKKPFSEEEKVILGKYKAKKTDGRFFVNQIPLSADDFIKETEEFLEQNKNKKAVFLDLDHAGLLKAKNDNKKLAIDDMVEGLNRLKNKYENFVVCMLMQANRSVLLRLKEKSNESRLRRDDLSTSDAVYQISDFVYGLQNANYLGIEEYTLINPEKYPHLSHRFTEENKHGKVSLITEGCIFVEVLKDRTADIGFTDLFTIEIKPFEKKTFNSNPFSTMPNFGEKTIKTERKLTPIADLPPIENIFDMNVAFPKEEKEPPF
jgi:hypothetical protein